MSLCWQSSILINQIKLKSNETFPRQRACGQSLNISTVVQTTVSKNIGNMHGQSLSQHTSTNDMPQFHNIS